jgi:hypothetical protein
MNLVDSWSDSLDGGPALSQGRYLHRTTQTQKKRRQTSIPWVGFEPTIPVFQRAKTFRASQRAATAIGFREFLPPKLCNRCLLIKHLYHLSLHIRPIKPPCFKYSNNTRRSLWITAFIKKQLHSKRIIIIIIHAFCAKFGCSMNMNYLNMLVVQRPVNINITW